MFCNIWDECKCKPDGKNCMDPTSEEAIEIVEVEVSLPLLFANALQGAAEEENEIIGRRNHHSERELVSHVFLWIHQHPCLLHKRPPAVLGLQRWIS